MKSSSSEKKGGTIGYTVGFTNFRERNCEKISKRSPQESPQRSLDDVLDFVRRNLEKFPGMYEIIPYKDGTQSGSSFNVMDTRTLEEWERLARAEEEAEIKKIQNSLE